MENQAIQSNLSLENFENAVLNGNIQETNIGSLSLPSFENISHAHNGGESRRDILMPIQQNIIGSSTNFTQIQSGANGTVSPLSKGSSSLLSSTSSSAFSISSEEGIARDSRGKMKVFLTLPILYSITD